MSSIQENKEGIKTIIWWIFGIMAAIIMSLCGALFTISLQGFERGIRTETENAAQEAEIEGIKETFNVFKEEMKKDVAREFARFEEKLNLLLVKRYGYIPDIETKDAQ